jgi:hypothetical protein
VRCFKTALTVKGAPKVPWRLRTSVAFVLLLVSVMVRPAFAGNGRVIEPAAAGLAASIAVGDFDADGRPDVATADRVGGFGDTAFEMRVELSGGRAETMRFRSSEPILAVTAVDIDHDNDLDLVFTEAVGRQIVSVWLNDGAGHFAAGGRDNLPSTLVAMASLVIPSPLSSGLVATSTRTVDAIISSSQARAPAPSTRIGRLDDDFFAASHRDGFPDPRGPPTSPHLIDR